MSDKSQAPSPAPVPTVNPTAQDAVTTIENLGEKGEQMAEAAIIAQAPFMGTPVLKQLWESAFDYLVKLILRPIASLGGRVVIDVQEYIALKSSAAAQAALDSAKKNGDSNAIQKASDDVDKAVAGVIQYVGATHS